MRNKTEVKIGNFEIEFPTNQLKSFTNAVLKTYCLDEKLEN